MSSGSWDPGQADDDPVDAIQSAAEFIEEIESLQDDNRYRFAVETLEGIHTTVEKSGRVTEGQRRAIDNIKASVERR